MLPRILPESRKTNLPLLLPDRKPEENWRLTCSDWFSLSAQPRNPGAKHVPVGINHAPRSRTAVRKGITAQSTNHHWVEKLEPSVELAVGRIVTLPALAAIHLDTRRGGGAIVIDAGPGGKEKCNESRRRRPG